MDYKITINDFEGPLDLLLHLIKKNNIDILTINISEITDEYLKYIRKMQKLDITIASEYLVMASNLLEIKSKSLLPKSNVEVDDDYDEARDDLISKLIEYEKYKNITPNFIELKNKRDEIHTKSPSNINDYITEDMKTIGNLDINILVEAMNKFLNRKQEEKPLNTKITRKELSVTEKCEKIRELLKIKEKIYFNDIFDICTKPYVVTSFLSLLELVKSNEIIINQDNNFNEITISRKS